MIEQPPDQHVTVSGDRTGEYVVREERVDGTLVLEPAARTGNGTARRDDVADLDQFVGALRTRGELRRAADALRAEWS